MKVFLIIIMLMALFRFISYLVIMATYNFPHRVYWHRYEVIFQVLIAGFFLCWSAWLLVGV